MKYCSLFLSKIRKNVAKLASAAVVLGALRVNVLCVVFFPDKSNNAVGIISLNHMQFEKKCEL